MIRGLQYTQVPDGLQRCDRLSEDQLSKLYSHLEKLNPGSVFNGSDGPLSSLCQPMTQLLHAMETGTDEQAFSALFFARCPMA